MATQLNTPLKNTTEKPQSHQKETSVIKRVATQAGSATVTYTFQDFASI
ncbi:hypothetical protein [Loktanella sp. SALINAS62]|nr:hypothetical protein [Loktanella sp. SALINAS62]MBS1302814.1 hypothetical protein [Loktanella sp. SALINAS62]